MALNIDDQIRSRIIADEDVFSDAFVSLSEVVMGKELFDLFSAKKAESSTKALTAVLEYYGIHKTIEIPESITDPDERLNYVIAPEGIMRRGVVLTDKWYKNAFGAFIGTLDDGTTIALIPGFRGYHWVNSITGEKVKITAKNASRISPDAVCFYAPLPQDKITVKDLLRHVLRSLSAWDFLKIVLCALVTTLLSMIVPRTTQYIYNDIVLQPDLLPLLATATLLICADISRLLVDSAKTIILSGISIMTDASITSTVMMRVLNLPLSFFRETSAGELYSRMSCASRLCSTILRTILSGCLTVLMSLMYFRQIFSFSSSLVGPSLMVVLTLTVYSVIVVFVQASVTRDRMEASASESGFMFSMISGMQKIRLAGAERRIFSQWAEHYKKTAKYTYSPPLIVKYNTTITMLINLVGTGFIYFAAYKNGILPAQYMAFIAAYALLSGAFSSLTASAMEFASVPPILKFVDPIFDVKPEVNSNQRIVPSLSGKIEVSGVSFRYKDNDPLVLDNLSLRINPGDYVAIVGKSGCGKSTLMRLLLGFEKPQQGSISYDSLDITTIDPRSLRRHIGCVMQNAGLFTGSLRSNITVSAPLATDEEVWRAVRIAGLEEDIKRMPMGLHTMVSESSPGISGGQKQRVMIARAIATDPDILFFDEATSALDNYTQKIVADSLAALNCTRVVVAHRLSTVRSCSRIIMLDGGRIIEDGTYDELIAKDGEFAKLVRRQQI